MKARLYGRGIMDTRIDLRKYIGSNLGKAMLNFSFEAHKQLEPSLLNLIDIRASQINGCGYCLDMHTKDARAAGETEQRIYTVNAWRDTPFFTDRERAALEWTEAVTLVADTNVPDDVYERVKKQFNEEELVALTFAVIVINSWNRLNVSFKPLVGDYKPRAVAAV